MKSLVSITVSCLILSIIAASAADIWLSERIAILGSFAGLQYSLNPGIAWGIRLPPVIQEVLIGLALIAVLFMALGAMGYGPWAHRSKHRAQSTELIAFGMILGGGAANIVDRLRDGYVTDYFQIGSFPIFNVADSFVTIGVALLLFETVLRRGASS